MGCMVSGEGDVYVPSSQEHNRRASQKQDCQGDSFPCHYLVQEVWGGTFVGRGSSDCLHWKEQSGCWRIFQNGLYLCTTAIQEQRPQDGGAGSPTAISKHILNH